MQMWPACADVVRALPGVRAVSRALALGHISVAVVIRTLPGSIMQTIRAIFQDGNLKPLDPLDLPENTRLTVALLDSDDVSADAIAKLARADRAFEFLNDPREDIYIESDGEAV